MELSSREGDHQIPISIPIPLNTTFGHGHMIHHDPPQHNNHIIPCSTTILPQIGIPTNGSTQQQEEEDQDHVHHQVQIQAYKKMVKYRECLKNHAASMGGNATDGCGEFMASGEEGTIEALTCSACNCHRNFHRKEIEGEVVSPCDFYHHNNPHSSRVIGRKVILGHHHHHKNGILATPEAIGYHRAGGPHQMIMSYNMGGGSLPSESDEQDQDGGGVVSTRAAHFVKKRFRTKFTQEQKEKMLNFAEKVGWKIQKQEESVVQQFCQEIGVKRRVLKVWMHNNKHNLAKKQNLSPPTTA